MVTNVKDWTKEGVYWILGSREFFRVGTDDYDVWDGGWRTPLWSAPSTSSSYDIDRVTTLCLGPHFEAA